MLYYHPSLAPNADTAKPLNASTNHIYYIIPLAYPHSVCPLLKQSSPINHRFPVSVLKALSYHSFKSNQQLCKALPLQQNVTGHSHFCSWVFSDCDLSFVFVLDVLCLRIQAAGVPAGLKGSFSVLSLLSFLQSAGSTINVPFDFYFLNPAGLLKALSAASALFCLVAPQLAHLRWVQHPATDSVGTSSFLLFSQSVMGGSVA